MDLPKDGQLIALILKSFGIAECEPQVIGQLLEFVYSNTITLHTIITFTFLTTLIIGHVTETLQDAAQFAEHTASSNNTTYNSAAATGVSPITPPTPTISLNDVRFAIQSRASHYFRLPPSRDLMLELAVSKNSGNCKKASFCPFSTYSF